MAYLQKKDDLKIWKLSEAMGCLQTLVPSSKKRFVKPPG